MKDHEVALMSPDQTAGETLPDAPALLRRSDVFCMAPWASVNIQQNGDVLPCCYANHDSTEVLGNLRRSRLSDVWNSEATRRLRLNMLQGRSSPACAKCYAYERSRFPSLRSEMNRDFAHLWPAVAGTGPDGTAAAPPRFLDIRFSNVCNFKCRYCGVYVSTAWYADHKRMGRTPPASLVQTPTRTPEDLWREIEPLLPGLERIYFTGGEPLLAPQTYQLLERLIERRAFHVTLQFSTNLSLTRSNGRDIFDLWNRFDRVEVGASLDAMGARGEFIRKNQNWEETVRNRERMIRASPKAVFAITPTMTALNVLHLPDFHADWVRRGFIAPDDIHSNLLFQPEEYSVQILPAALKRRAEEKYASHAEWLRREYGDLTGKAVECFRGIVDFMNARDGSSLLEKFRAATRTLDALRKESITAVFPELKEVFESSGASGISADPPGGIQTVLDDHFPQELGASREGIPAAKAAVSFSRALRAVGHRTPAQAPTAFRRLAGSKVFCLLPWTHLDVRLDGVYSCHASDRPLGKLAAGGVSAMWNSEPLRRLRLNMLAGKESPQCAGCYAQERAGGKSPREWYNAELAAFGPLVDATGLEGSLPEGVIPYLQLEHSNVCNFKCRCCDASKSTAWHADQQRLSGRLNGPVVVTPSSDTSLAEDVRRLLPTAANRSCPADIMKF